MKIIQSAIVLCLFAVAAHAVDPSELFQHLDQAKIEESLKQETLDEQASKLALGMILRQNYVYLDPSTLEAIAAAPDQRGFVNFNAFPGENYYLELRYEASLDTGFWHTIYGASDSPGVITGPQPVAVSKESKGLSNFPRLGSVGFSGYIYPPDGTYRFLAVTPAPNLYVIEDINREYSVGESSEPLLPPGVASDPPSAQGVDDRVVARLLDHSITYSEIACSKEEASLSCQISRHAQTLPELCSGEEVEALRKDLERSRLHSTIRGEVERKAIEDLGVETSELEARAAWDQLFFEGMGEEVRRESYSRYMRLIEAVEAVYENGEDPGAVHERLLSEDFPLQVWERMLVGYRELENRRPLLSMRSWAKEQFYSPEGGRDGAIRMQILGANLNEAVDREIGKVDPRFVVSLATWRAAVEKTSNQDLPEFLAASQEAATVVSGEAARARDYVEAARLAWWAERYTEARIEILDPEFASVLERFPQLGEE